jgi:hypothetical protein
MAGTFISNVLGFAVDVNVDPTTEREGAAPNAGNVIEVTIM